MKILLIILLLTSGLFAQTLSTVEWDGTSVYSSSIGLGYKEVPVAIYTLSEFSGSTVSFQVAEDIDGIFMDVKDSELAEVSFSFADSTYVGVYSLPILGVRARVRVKSSSTEVDGTELKIITIPTTE